MTHDDAKALIARAKSAVQDLENEAADANDDDAAENYGAVFGHLCDALDSLSNNDPISQAA